MDDTRRRLKPQQDQFPFKVELHVHLDGAMRLSTLFELAKAKGIDVGCSTLDEFRDKICVYDALSLYKVLQSFTVFMSIIAGDRNAIKRIAYEFCEDCAKHNVRYVEARYSPQLLADNEARPQYAKSQGDLTPKEVVRIVSEQFKKGSADFGISAKSILCCMRDRPDWADEVVKLAAEFRNDGVVGIDIAGGSDDPTVGIESIFPEHVKAFKNNDPAVDIENIFPKHVKEFKEAKALGINITAHAGEASSAHIVKRSLDELCADRIGHGYRSVEDESVYEEIKARQVHVEMCPLSSICTGAVPPDIQQHPVVKFANDGVNFSLSTDDPMVFDSCLLDDYTAAMKAGLTEKQIIQSIFNAAKACFAHKEEKDELLRELEKVYRTGDVASSRP